VSWTRDELVERAWDWLRERHGPIVGTNAIAIDCADFALSLAPPAAAEALRVQEAELGRQVAQLVREWLELRRLNPDGGDKGGFVDRVVTDALRAGFAQAPWPVEPKPKA